MGGQVVRSITAVEGGKLSGLGPAHPHLEHPSEVGDLSGYRARAGGGVSDGPDRLQPPQQLQRSPHPGRLQVDGLTARQGRRHGARVAERSVARPAGRRASRRWVLPDGRGKPAGQPPCGGLIPPPLEIEDGDPGLPPQRRADAVRPRRVHIQLEVAAVSGGAPAAQAEVRLGVGGERHHEPQRRAGHARQIGEAEPGLAHGQVDERRLQSGPLVRRTAGFQGRSHATTRHRRHQAGRPRGEVFMRLRRERHVLPEPNLSSAVQLDHAGGTGPSGIVGQPDLSALHPHRLDADRQGAPCLGQFTGRGARCHGARTQRKPAKI
jgi:hypothetical protein